MSPASSPAPPTLRSFPPVVSVRSRLLILGSMPGAASLRAGQYYANPGNAFWPIMGALFGAHPALEYAERLRRLDQAGVALWDVLASCTRAGSLDAAIRDAAPNDFATLFTRHPGITRVFFNGSAALALFRRHAAPRLPASGRSQLRLPSTSAAHARLRADAKIAVWRAALLG